MRNLISLLLLASFGLGLAAGPHPCMAVERVRETPTHSCHQAAGPASDLQVRAGVPSHDVGEDCCDTSCRHACHMQAVSELKPATFAMVLVSVAGGETPRCTLPLFVHPIDHIPLA